MTYRSVKITSSMTARDVCVMSQQIREDKEFDVVLCRLLYPDHKVEFRYVICNFFNFIN